MKNWVLLMFLCCNFVVAQNVNAKFIQKTPLAADFYVGNDTFNNQYFIKDNVFYKKQGLRLFRFNDFQLGKLESVDILNPLKIILFYRNTNTVVVLDNKLTEIRRLDFDEVEPHRNIGYVGVAGDNNLWVFNVDVQRLEVLGFNRRQNVPRTKPINGKVEGFESNYNFCWVFTPNNILQFNVYGVLVAELPIVGIEALEQSNGNLVFFKNKKLYYLSKNTVTPVLITIPETDIEQFYINNEILYIYGNGFVDQYELTFAKK